MKAAIVQAHGQIPVYADFPEPVAADGEVVVEVAAAALSPLVKGRALGAHYSSKGRPPFIAGVDGVGRLSDGRRVYFVLARSPFGAMAERTVVRAGQCLPLPDDLDDVAAAALANPGMSSWAALTERARLQAGETVWVNGANGRVGPAGGADRQAPGRRQGDRQRAQPGNARGPRRARGRRRDSVGGRSALRGGVRARGRCGDRLSLGRERRLDAEGRGQGRAGAQAAPLRPDWRGERRGDRAAPRRRCALRRSS